MFSRAFSFRAPAAATAGAVGAASSSFFNNPNEKRSADPSFYGGSHSSSSRSVRKANSKSADTNTLRRSRIVQRLLPDDLLANLASNKPLKLVQNEETEQTEQNEQDDDEDHNWRPDLRRFSVREDKNLYYGAGLDKSGQDNNAFDDVDAYVRCSLCHRYSFFRRAQ